MPKVTYAKFFNYQGAFYHEVANADMQIEIGIESSSAPSGDFLKDFTGSNNRTITWTTFNALYQSDVRSFDRSKVGIPSDEEGIVYLSPLQLIPIYGTFEIDKLATHVRKSGKEFILHRVTYLEPLYGSCLAIELMMTDIIRGGR